MNKLIFDFKKLFIALIVMLVVQYLVGILLAMIGIYGLLASAIMDFFIAFALVYIYTPSRIRKYALKTTQFHYNVLTYFIILFIFSLLQWIL